MDGYNKFSTTPVFIAVAILVSLLFPLSGFAHPMSKALDALRSVFYSSAGLGIIMAYCLLAFALGALHALTPGHGKTIIAAYIVGSKGRMVDALTLGVATTASHTSGVIILGLVVIYAFNQAVPPKVTPYLSMLSGLMIICIGAYLIILREKRHYHRDHFNPGDHDHGHYDHTHHPHSHREDRTTVPIYHNLQTSDQPKSTNFWKNIMMGISGGMIPCPTALVILFLAISLNKVGLGLTLIVCFSVGLAATLTMVGILFAKGSHIFENHFEDNSFVQKLPLFSASIMVFLGGAMVVKSALELGWTT